MIIPNANRNQLIRHIMQSESPLTVFCQSNGDFLVMYHKLIECHRLLNAGRKPLLRDVCMDSDERKVRAAVLEFTGRD